MKKLLLLSIVFVVGCRGNKPKEKSGTATITIQLVTEDGKPIDSNTVIPPSPGIRNYYYYDGKSWDTTINSVPLLQILEFIYKGVKGQESYIVTRMKLSGFAMDSLRWFIWDDKMFNCDGSYNEEEKTLDGFEVNMDNNGTLHGGSLRTLKKRIELFFHPKISDPL